MSIPSKPLKLYGSGGPNPSKVRMILEELGLNYEVVNIPLSDTKNPDYVKVNPNGRIPALEDPNTGITLWESGAIIEYLVELYDKQLSLSFPQGTPEYFQAKQYLFFQASGQGPYYGQAVWFTKYHHEQLESAKTRYYNEAKRVTGVLESILAKQEEKYGSAEGPWLVGNKCSYADISFVMWQVLIKNAFGEQTGLADEAAFPKVTAWLNKLSSRPKTGAVIQAAFAAMASGKH